MYVKVRRGKLQRQEANITNTLCIYLLFSISELKKNASTLTRTSLI